MDIMIRTQRFGRCGTNTPRAYADDLASRMLIRVRRSPNTSEARRQKAAGDRKVKTKYLPRAADKTQKQGADEDDRLLTARRKFHSDMLTRFPNTWRWRMGSSGPRKRSGWTDREAYAGSRWNRRV